MRLGPIGEVHASGAGRVFPQQLVGGEPRRHRTDGADQQRVGPPVPDGAHEMFLAQKGEVAPQVDEEDVHQVGDERVNATRVLRYVQREGFFGCRRHHSRSRGLGGGEGRGGAAMRGRRGRGDGGAGDDRLG